MQQRSAKEYLYLGAIHWYLRTNQNVRSSKGLAETIVWFEGELVRLKLPISVRVGAPLWAVGKRVGNDSYPGQIAESDLKEMRDAAGALEMTLHAELESQVMYILQDRRFDTEKLMNSAQHLLGAGVYVQLPSGCVSDFEEACRSVAFGLPTAAAFHLMRCVEGALRHSYQSVVRRNRLPKHKMMWYAMTRALEARQRGSIPQELVDTLDRIRVQHRNPTQHPDKVYDLDQAQDLLGLSIDALNRMVNDKTWRLPEDSFSAVISAVEARLADEAEAETEG